MKKVIAMSLATLAALNASGINETFVAGKASGEIRVAYVNQDNAVDTDTYGSSLGGQLKYETAAWNDIKLGVAAYVSQKLHFATGNDDQLNPDFFDAEGKSFAYVGEAYLDYSAKDITLRVGRQLIDTPLADTDDIRMHPNTFEAAMATYSGIEGTTFVGGYMTRWAGYDAPQGHNDSISKFQKFGSNHQSDGTSVIGVMNESIENLALQGWYYHMNKISNAFYTEAAYTIPFTETAGLELVGQFANFSEDENSGLDGNVYGIGASVNIGRVIVGAAYNKTSNYEGKIVGNGFGGGPYLTSMEEMTIDGMEDAKAYQLSGEIDMSDAGLKGLTFTALYGVFKSVPADAKVNELDLIATYKINEALCADVSYAKIDDRNNNFDAGDDAGYDRFLARIHYSF
jgi:hypothetical protein